jgi:transposase InsO family protein
MPDQSFSNEALRDIRRKLRVLKAAEESGNVSATCRRYGVSRSAFYEWKKAFAEQGEAGLVNSKPCPVNLKARTPQHVEELILHLRKHYYFGQQKIVWYLARYHQIKISISGVRGVFQRHHLERLPKNAPRRCLPTIRYEKQVPGHHVQIDVKFLNLRGTDGAVVRRYQYTAIDDSTRIRALQIHERHNQATAIQFVDYVLEKFPFRIHTIRTDNGHEFQSQFHWHVEDKGIRHSYIKPRSPRLNGKVERSHRTDQEEFYQLLEYTDDVDLKAKLRQWEDFYNLYRPHGAFAGRTPFEVLRDKLAVTSPRSPKSVP